MSSPHNQTVSVSQFTILSSSPLKPSNYYFQEQEANGGQLLQEEKFRPTTLTFKNESTDNNGGYLSQHDENEDDFVVPVSQHGQNASNNAFKNNGYLKYAVSNVFSPNTENLNYEHQEQLHAQQQHFNQIQYAQENHQHSSQPQMNLYPPMEFHPSESKRKHSKSPNPSTNVKASESSNTLASHDSVPLLAMSTSLSDTSIASPISFQNHSMATPRRPANSRRLSTTTPSQTFQTPSQHPSIYTSPTVKHANTTTPSSSIQKSKTRHRRTRSRLSLDASGAAAIVTIHKSTSTNSIRSPAASGTNPFYTPPAFLSPLAQAQKNTINESPSATPLATPSAVRKYNSFSSISPNMLMNPGADENNQHHGEGSRANNSVFIAAEDLDIKLAGSKFIKQSHINHPHPHQQQQQQHDYFTNTPLIDFHQQQLQIQLQQQRAVSNVNQPNFVSDPIHAAISQQSQQQFYQPHFVHHQHGFSISDEHQLMAQIPENVSDTSKLSNSSSLSSLSSNGQAILITTQGPDSMTRTVSVAKPLSRSHSSINLSSIIAPPEVQHYDILEPNRKRLNKSNSTTSIIQTNEALVKMGKPPKKVHSCPFCNAVFQRPEHVKRHMRSHSSEKPFECDQEGCGKRFNRPDNLKAHLRKIHKCDI